VIEKMENNEHKQKIKRMKKVALNWTIFISLLIIISVIVFKSNVDVDNDDKTISMKCYQEEFSERAECCQDYLGCKNMTPKSYGVFWEDSMLCGCLTVQESLEMLTMSDDVTICPDELSLSFNWDNGVTSCINQSAKIEKYNNGEVIS